MMEKLENHGSRIFEDHELLEMLLFFSLPRINTNVIAHRLLERFGSVEKVLSASVQELTSVEGIGPKSASMIKTVKAVLDRCNQKETRKITSFKSIDDIGRYVIGLFEGQSQECLYAVLIDHKGKRIATVNVAIGNIDSLEMIPSVVVNNAIRYQCTNVVLAHNHPFGQAEPSPDDILMTARVRYALALSGVTLIEHFVVSENEYYPIMEKNKFNMKNKINGM